MLLLVHLVSEFPNGSSPDPALAVARGGGHAFDVPGKHDAVSFWVDLPHGQAFRAFNMEYRSAFHLAGQQFNLPRKGTARGSAGWRGAGFPNGIADIPT